MDATWVEITRQVMSTGGVLMVLWWLYAVRMKQVNLPGVVLQKSMIGATGVIAVVIANLLRHDALASAALLAVGIVVLLVGWGTAVWLFRASRQ